MSIRITNAVWKRARQKKSGALVVLLAIADYANEDNIAYPAVATLARKARMSVRNVQRWLRILEQDGELNVLRNKGRRGVNIYKLCLPSGIPDEGDTHVTNDIGGVNPATHVSSSGDARVTQSVNQSSIQPTPVVPKGGDADFWIETCFKCFGQSVHSVRQYVLRALSVAIPALTKSNADSLVQFYRAEPLDSKEAPYSSRRHSPERLILDLPRQLALAVQAHPPAKPKEERAYTIKDVQEYLTRTYPGCYLPPSLDALENGTWEHIKWEIYDAMSKQSQNAEITKKNANEQRL